MRKTAPAIDSQNISAMVPDHPAAKPTGSRHASGYHKPMMRRVCRAILVLGLIHAACKPRPGPIEVGDNVVSIQNQTSRDWRNVVVTVNDHFRGGAPTLAAGSRMAAPLSQFQTAFGQRYDVSRQMVFRIEVTATDANGEPVKLELDKRERK
jgi:hypothetical protein